MFPNLLCYQQALAKCGLVQERPSQDTSSNALDNQPPQRQDDVILVCNKLLSARCVRQQIEAIQEHKQAASVAPGQQNSEQSPLNPTELMLTNTQAGLGSTTECGNIEESTLRCCADGLEQAMETHTDARTAADVTTAALPCIRYWEAMVYTCTVCTGDH